MEPTNQNEAVFEIGKKFINTVKFKGNQIKYDKNFLNNFEKLILMINREIINPMEEDIRSKSHELLLAKETIGKLNNNVTKLMNDVNKLKNIIGTSKQSLEPVEKNTVMEEQKNKPIFDFDINMY